jgi:hypothetical protein
VALVPGAQLLAAPAKGPLRVHPENGRYFTDGTEAADGSLEAVYLTGSHTWDNLVDMGREYPPEAFDFDAYLAFLERHHHNFIRLWTWDSFTWDTRANRRLGKEFVHRVAPLPWARTGPGNAADGQPKFDLTRFDPAWFDRLESRVRAAGERGIYVSVMLFEGWGLMHGNRGRSAPDGWAWRSHPFHPANNVNGVAVPQSDDGLGGHVHRLGGDALRSLQAAYIRKVVDTVNRFDNVLYEVINEGGDKEWDWWVAETIEKHETALPKQHPVGITGHGAEGLESMLASPAHWISPGRRDGYADDPPAWDGSKVSLLDTDHIWGVGGNAGWVWKSFVRGHNPIFMDPYDGAVLGTRGDPRWEPIRAAMGQTRRLAERVDLARLEPRPELASTEYCLARPGKAYVVYAPARSAAEGFTVELPDGVYRSAWLHPVEGEREGGGTVKATGGEQRFTAPFAGDAVLYIVEGAR